MAISELALPEGVIAHCLKKPQQMATSLAHNVADALRQAIVARGVATLVVSGGRSPIAFFEALAAQPLDWAKVVISLADERWVPVTHPTATKACCAASASRCMRGRRVLSGSIMAGPRYRRLQSG